VFNDLKAGSADKKNQQQEDDINHWRHGGIAPTGRFKMVRGDPHGGGSIFVIL
jgi:hypothetical protein